MHSLSIIVAGVAFTLTATAYSHEENSILVREADGSSIGGYEHLALYGRDVDDIDMSLTARKERYIRRSQYMSDLEALDQFLTIREAAPIPSRRKALHRGLAGLKHLTKHINKDNSQNNQGINQGTYQGINQAVSQDTSQAINQGTDQTINQPNIKQRRDLDDDSKELLGRDIWDAFELDEYDY